ncbi:hypothetical protein [Nocardia concava]|uniref:hypothetical protein n=1 Tax=Nocardia concava TaxID=257281 RepID=UPI0003098F8E|nr:hypothetical protein [Nocardia concava]
MNTFQTSGPIFVNVDSLVGNVTVIASDRKDAVVGILPTDPAKKADVKAAAQVQVEFVDGVLSVWTPKNWRPFGGKSSIEVTIEVPAGSQVKAADGVGQLRGVGALGEAELEMAFGDIVVESPLGSVSAKTSKGDIHIGEAVDGVLKLETATGDLVVGISAGSAAVLEHEAGNGAVHNQLLPVGQKNGGTVHVYAKNSYGNVVIGHATAA